jgi:hypothetical protein
LRSRTRALRGTGATELYLDEVIQGPQLPGPGRPGGRGQEGCARPLRTKPPVDEAAQAERRAARAAKEGRAGREARAKKAAEEAEKAAKLAAEEAERVAQAEREAAARITMPTQAELKAARDARYAARKARK